MPDLSIKKLPLSFYHQEDVVKIAKELLGKILVTNWDGALTSGRIVETEAYAGASDRASHAFRGRTPRTQIMFEEGGKAYVYLCYGIHQMFNIVTNKKDMPHAILIRGVEPLQGIDVMLSRTRKTKLDESLTRGPGNVGKAFGFHTSHCGLSLVGEDIYILDDRLKIKKEEIGISARIGVQYAGPDAAKPYRFFIIGNKYVSGPVKSEC
ncbi:MAG: DNA-3-methyladenine glycosylase [Flavisolibacter sp.]